MKPLDLTEWAQGLAIGSGPNADFAREVLDLIENNRADDWAELVEDLEFAVGHRKIGAPPPKEGFTHDQARKALEGLTDSKNLLEEIKDTLAGAGFLKVRSAPEDGLQEILDKLERVSDIMDWVRSPEDHAEAIADLRKLFPLPEPKKPEPPKLEFDL